MIFSTNQRFSVGQEVFLLPTSDPNFNPKTAKIEGVHRSENNSIWYQVIYYSSLGIKRDAWYEQSHLFQTPEEANLVLNTQIVV